MQSSESSGLRFLHVHNVALYDSGEVRLLVEHPNNTNCIRSVFTSLTVIPRSLGHICSPRRSSLSALVATEPKLKFIPKPSPKPAYIIERPESCTALRGDCVRLTVLFDGIPCPQVTWFKAVSANSL